MEKKVSIKHALLVICLLLSLVISACTKSKPNTVESVSPNTSTDVSKLLDPNMDPVKDGFGKYSPAIEVTTVQTNNGVATSLKNGDTIENNIYTRTWADTLGINMKFKWTAPAEQADEKMNLMLSGGDLPDFFSVTPSQFQKLVSTGQLADISQVLKDYASKYTKQYLTGDYAGLLDGVTANGKVYGIPNGASYTDSGNMLWTRSDELDKAGLAIPKTVAELDKILEAFKSQDLDGTGQKLRYPIALADANIPATAWGVGDAFFNMFHAYPNIWVLDSKGNLEDGMFGQEYRGNTRQALLKLQDYYKKGYIHPDFATMNSDKYNEMITNGQSAITFSGLWDAWFPLNLTLDKNPKAKWLPSTIPSVDDKLAKSSVTAAFVIGINVAKKGVKNPEALVKMANLYHSLNNDPKTMQFGKYNTDPVDNSGIFQVYPMPVYDPSFNYEAFQAVSNAFKTGKTTDMSEAFLSFYKQSKAYADTSDKAGFPSYLSYTDKGSLAVVDDYIKRKAFQMNEYTTLPTQAMNDNAPIIKKAYDVMFLNVVKGGNISLYDDFLKEYDSLYAANVDPGVNKWFADKNKVSIQKWFDNK
jgi:putative aldouronate transport system substrate-binding protein